MIRKVASLRVGAIVPRGVKPGDRVKVIHRACGCIRFRVNGLPRRQVLRCAKHAAKEGA